MKTEDKINRATRSLAEGEIGRARRLIEQVLTAEPDNLKGLWLAASIQESRGEVEPWLETLNKLKELLPRELYVVEELSRAYSKVNRLGDALKLLSEYLKVAPDSATARYNYAHYLARAGDYKESVAQYEKVLYMGLENPEEVHLNLSNLFSERLGDHQMSRHHLSKALELNPKYAAAWFNLGNLNEQMGNLVGARTCFDKVTEIDDKAGGALARIADLTRFDERDEVDMLRAMEEKLHGNENPNPDLMFSLGRAYEQTGKHKESIYMFESANAIDRRFLPSYEKDAMTAFLGSIKEAYSDKRDLMGAGKGLGQVFICGNFRSGSTLLEQMLAGHSRFTAGGERGYFRKVARDTRINFPSERVLKTKIRTEIAEQYNSETVDLFGLGARVTDKRPDNLILIGLIKEILPEAKIIITQRDPLDVAWSIFTTRFGPEVPYATSVENIRHFIGLQADIADHWSKIYEEDVIFVSYENLVADPKKELTELLDKLDEEWEEECLNFRTLKNFVTTASSAQVRRPINGDSVGRSRPFMEYMNKSG